MKQLETSMKKLQGASVDIGYFDGARHNGAEMSLASLMALMEYGSNDGKIPARFPFTQTAATDSPKKDTDVRKKVSQGITKTIHSGNTNNLLDILGKHYVDAVGSLFGDTTRLLKNAPLTIALKGKDSPLIEHGELLSKLSYRKPKKEKR
jgi:hypothetical protein